MAVDVATNLVRYLGNGSTSTPYPIPFRFDHSSWVNVVTYDAEGTVTTLELGVDFILAGNGTTADASLTTSDELAEDTALVIYRVAPPFQLLSLVPNSPLSAIDLETAMDRFVMAMQDRILINGPGLTFPPVEPADNAKQLPPPHLRVNKVLGFDANGALEVLDLPGLPAGEEGDILIRNSSGWVRLPRPNAAGLYVLGCTNSTTPVWIETHACD